MALSNNYIAHTQAWIQSVVIGLNFCPFASRPFLDQSIHYEVVLASNIYDSLEQLMVECIRLNDHPAIETTLMIFPHQYLEFNNYLHLVELSEALIKSEGYEGIYQIASFHPQYQFNGTDENDPSNYTNRSPYPMLHILREQTIEKILTIKDTSLIPEKNIQTARNLGLDYMKNIWKESFIDKNK